MNLTKYEPKSSTLFTGSIFMFTKNDSETHAFYVSYMKRAASVQIFITFTSISE